MDGDAGAADQSGLFRKGSRSYPAGKAITKEVEIFPMDADEAEDLEMAELGRP